MKEISFRGQDLTPTRLESLTSNHDLEKLVIWGGPVTNDQLQPLSRLAHLKDLVLGEMPIDDGVFQHLRPLHNLTHLNLAYTNVEGDFTALANLPLQDLRLEGCRRVGDRCARSLASFSSLRQLEIHMTSLTDDGLLHLASLPLEVLWLGGPITDRGIKALSTMTTLKHLDVCCPRVTDEGVRALSRLKGLEVLWLSNCRITDESIAPLSQLRSLREIALGKTAVTQSGRQRLSDLLPQCRQITEGEGG
ncbi:MAG: hypothetical protein JST93_13985 [Acidobacteria bacterium]|nr:hypothetical protein [Acidobacteriota bacterium]